jgi:large subunit ribosomal protein L22
MAEYKYAFQGFSKELMAKAVARDVETSTKQSIEICNYLRHRKLAQAKTILERVMRKEQAIPFKRFTNALGHKPGMASGRYPIKASKTFLKLLEAVEANAQTKGLNTGNLEIAHICCQKAAKQRHHGRSGGRKFKRSHIEVVVQEASKEEKKQEGKEGKKEKQAKPKEKKKE